MSKLEEFRAGERPEDVAFFIHDDAVDNPDALTNVAERVENGVLLIVDGENGRGAVQKAMGIDPMDLAQRAMGVDGEIDDDLAGGVCPVAEEEPDEDHRAKFVFAFVEEQNEEVGGLYAEGAVIHAYAVCFCGETYSEKWVVDEA